MKSTSTPIKSLVLIALLSPLFLLANENEHIMPGEGKLRTKEKASSPPLTEENTDTSLSNDRQRNESSLAYIFDNYPTSYYPPSIHWISRVSAFGNSLELEDGSTWKVSAYDQYKANNWRIEDPLVITQNHRWFSSYTYRIINKSSGASIEAELYFGPIKHGTYTLYVISIDPSRNIIEAINGKNEVTHWEICPRDWYAFDQWELNDAIIVGHNSGWESSYECILINVNMDNFVRAKQF